MAFDIYINKDFNGVSGADLGQVKGTFAALCGPIIECAAHMLAGTTHGEHEVQGLHGICPKVWVEGEENAWVS